MPPRWSVRRRHTDFAAEVRRLVAAGPAGEAELVTALPCLPPPRRSTVVAALGDARGPVGPAALRHELAGPDIDTGTRCAALLALAKREGVRASPELAAHLRHPSPHVRSCALHTLAVVGDDRAWQPALHRLERVLDRPAPLDRPDGLPDPDRPPSPATPHTLPRMPGVFEALVVITYLVRHLDDTRRTALLTVLRRRFTRLRRPERAFLTRHWPGCEPDGPDPRRLPNPDPWPFQSWARDPLFGPAL